MIKSIGPDRDKIIRTMQEFGTGYTYIIISYPPFLKALFDDDRIDWAQYDIVAAFGGEGISENMRSHILKYAHTAFGSYGASDLEINLGIETEYTVALRRAIAADPRLAARLTKQAEYGVLPMIFQFNPFDYLVETNDAGELVITIVRNQNINPRIRYNIHDRGHVMRLREVTPILEELGHRAVIAEQFLDLPLLFHYGRSDMSLDFNGAVVGPDTLRDVVYGDQELLGLVENHRLIGFEDDRGDRQLHIALQLTAAATAGEPLDADRLTAKVLADMRRINGDFDNAIKTAPDGTLPTIAFYGHRTGPFRGDGAKLKNEYVWQLPAGQVARWGLDLSRVAPRR
jgi:phenylacetate-CoA ligase